MYETMRDLAVVEYGASPKNIRVDESTPYKIYGSGGLIGYAKEFLFSGPLIVVARKGTLDKPTYSEENCWVIDTAYAVIPKEGVDPKWLYYQLTNYDLTKLNEATGVPSINRDLLYRINFPKTTSVKQNYISQILSIADSIIEKTQAAKDKYKVIKQGMLHDLFTRGIDVKTGKLRPRYEDAPELYKPSSLGMIPIEWEEGSFSEFADENISHSLTGGPFGSDLQTKDYTNTGIRIIQLQNIGDGIFKDDYKIFTSEEKANALISCNIYPGEIIISKMADPIARACFIPNIDKRYLMASDGIRLAVDVKKFNSCFVLETINYSRFRKAAELKSTGSTRARIGLTELKEINIAYPKKTEQDLIGSCLKSIVQKIEAEENYLNKMKQIKAGLMGDLLTGRREVKVDENNT